MKIGSGQLVCLAVGVLLLSLGGGLLGGRLAAEKHRAASLESHTKAFEPQKPSSIAEPPPLETEPEPAEASVPAASPKVSAPAKEPAGDLGGAEPAPQESPEPSPRRYVIQAMSTSNRIDAHAARKTILATGFPAGVFEADLAGKGKWYRVYVGPYDTEAEARLALEAVHKIPGFGESFMKTLE